MNEDLIEKLEEEDFKYKLNEYLDIVGADNKDNISDNVEFLRNTFLFAEKEYFKQISNNPNFQEILRQTNKYSSSQLFEVAEKLIQNMENDEITVDNEGKVELEILVLLAAIRDKVLSRIRIKTYETEEDEITRTR